MLFNRCPALLLALAVSASPAVALEPCDPADIVLSDRDKARLADLETSRVRGLAAALAAEHPGDQATVSELYSEGLAPLGELPSGAYQCRTIKLGGITPLVVYDFFTCEIAETGAGYEILKTSGSQRLSGELKASGDGLLYRGALHYSDEQPRAYAGKGDRDQVGCLFRAREGENTYVLELPDPVFESFHDVLVLIPAD
ncbi:DUF4893 domain-containing protein [Devosia pacifica]|uniref:DUF4893 domain-containing protein n=1 Tax=Devosia pacifica TaxID=1335967 RepID=A0A918S5J4_9HYPH|nr:DUF4893 domain-containing protein [Devosia pacifica]GHA24261.1 DUF4893 domain-containing protein [Devosia pacifica]